MTEIHCNPAARIIVLFGGCKPVAQAAKVDLSRVTRWRLPKSRGGTDGLIPQRHHIALLDHADANGIRLKPEDFYPSRKSSRRPRKQARR